MSATALKLMDEWIHSGRGRVTITEAAAATGLAIDQVKDALNDLIEKYACRLQVTENGDLIYDFGESPIRRDHKSAREILGEWLLLLWKGFAILYRIAIAAVLVIYFVIFLILLIVIVVAALSGKRSSDSSSSSSSSSSRSSSSRSSRSAGAMVMFSRLGRIFADIFDWRTVSGGFSYTQDDRGYCYRHADPKKSRLKEGKKSFIASVYDFVFGPPRYPSDPLADEKEVGQFLRDNKGLVVGADLSALAGLTTSRSQAFLTDCLIRYQGEVKVSENGVLYGEFDRILRGESGLQGGEVIYYWDEYEPEYELTGNDAKTNFLIILFNAVSLVFSVLIVFDLLEKFVPMVVNMDEYGLTYQLLNWLVAQLGRDQPVLSVGLGWFPLVFSTIFFAIPLIRKYRIAKRRETRHHHNILKRFYRLIFKTTRGRPVTLPQAIAELNTTPKEQRLNYEQQCLLASAMGRGAIRKMERLAPERVESILNELVLDLQGDTFVGEDGKMMYAFPRIAAELTEAGVLRRNKSVDRDLGTVIADSGPV